LKQLSFLLKLECVSNPELLCTVRGAMDGLTQRMGFSAPDSRSVTRAVDEAVANIIRHAYGGRPDQPIVMSCHKVQDVHNGNSVQGLEIVLQDQGDPADPAKMRGRALEEIRPGGLGLHYIRESMDVVEFSRTDGWNQLRLVKYLPPG